MINTEQALPKIQEWLQKYLIILYIVEETLFCIVYGVVCNLVCRMSIGIYTISTIQKINDADRYVANEVIDARAAEERTNFARRR